LDTTGFGVVIGLLAEELRQALGDLLLLSAHLRGVNPVTGRDRLDRFDALEGF
jgi:hypothetical protein